MSDEENLLPIKRKTKTTTSSNNNDDVVCILGTPNDPDPNLNLTAPEVPTFNQLRQHRPRSKYESLDYDICENSLWEKEQHSGLYPRFSIRKDFARWVISLIIGVLTALVGCFIAISIEEISHIKYSYLREAIQQNIVFGDLVWPFMFYMLTNIIPIIVGSTLVTFVEPVASGSGIPLIKCYLNGIKIPKVVRLKTLVVKAVGVITSVVGGLAGGKEGPMVHCGAVIAAGISQGKSTSLNSDFRVFRYFRDDHEKRDFVVCGASAGVAAAFGAPIGGLLFSLEEAASFWNQSLIWRTLFASIVSSFTLNLVLSAYHGLKSATYHGLFNMGEFEPFPFSYYELPIFMMMGAFGGLMGALWNFFNTKLMIFRERFLKPKISRVVEACLIAGLSCLLACAMMYFMSDCQPLEDEPNPNQLQMFCEDNQYNAVARLWFQTPEASVKALFHDPIETHKIETLMVYVPIYFLLSCLTYGLNVSLGIFIPCLLVGAAWGRLIALIMNQAFPYASFFLPGKYALIGAAAQLGGVVRMKISLAVILVETTGNIWFVLPIILTLSAAKWMGDYFNEGIYDTQIEVAHVPMLSWYAPAKHSNAKAVMIMSEPVICVRMKEKVSYIIHILHNTGHNGFPVVDEVDENNRSNGRLRGLILRSQLIVILKRSLFEETSKLWESSVDMETFRNEYPRFPSIRDVHVGSDKRAQNYTINLEIFMNPTPYNIHEGTSVPRIFQLFRALGLRHLIVVDSNNHVKGIITRKDFLK